jgi:hypothetical protein
VGIVTVYVLYLLVSIGLTVLSAATLARSGKIFLTHVFQGDEPLGQAVSRLFVVGSCLLNLGFVILAMRSSAAIHDTRQAIELLSVKLGEVMLIIGLLHVISVLILTRIRRRAGSRSPVEWRSTSRPDSTTTRPEITASRQDATVSR